MTAPRIEPVGIDTLTASQQAILDRIPGNGLKGEHAPVNVLGTLLRAPSTLTEFLDWWVAGKQRMRLSVREQELVILRMGVLYGSEYVWRHHVVVGREFGVDDCELDALREGRFEVFDEPRERAYLELTDELVERRDVDDATWERVHAVLDDEQVLELIGLVSQYVLFALTNKVFRVALEPSMLPVPAIASR
jgi:4-carboxymuconolactone decarboxylase